MPCGPKTTLDLYRSTATADGMGGESYTWAIVASIEGTLSILSDRERMMYGKKAEGADYKFIVDYEFVDSTHANATTMDRFYLGTREFEITSRENPMNQNRYMIFLLSEGVNG